MKDASYTSTATVSLFIKPYLSHPLITTDAWVEKHGVQNTIPDKKSAFGIRKVMINGKMVCENGALDTEALKTSGKAIRG